MGSPEVGTATDYEATKRIDSALDTLRNQLVSKILCQIWFLFIIGDLKITMMINHYKD